MESSTRTLGRRLMAIRDDIRESRDARAARKSLADDLATYRSQSDLPVAERPTGRRATWPTWTPSSTVTATRRPPTSGASWPPAASPDGQVP